jgi:hypothetical protein
MEAQNKRNAKTLMEENKNKIKKLPTSYIEWHYQVIKLY